MSETPNPSSSGNPVRLVVGLGNPGRDYARTRHNVGFMIADRLAEERQARWATEKKWKAEVARDGDLTLLKPQTYMNLSGEAVSQLCRFFKIAPESVLVVFDDVDLPLGRLRIRQSGSAGGHNGVKSIIQHLGTDRIPRLKFGIGRNRGDGAPMTGHVLGRFAPDEIPVIEKSLAQAQDAVNYALANGLAAAMNRFNTDPEKAAKLKKKTQKPKPDPDQPAEAEPAPDSETPDHPNQTES